MNSVNPRVLLGENGGAGKLRERLVKSGYSPQDRPFSALCNAIRRGTPLLIQGHRGSGKTALAEALAEALDLRLYTLPCLTDTSTDQILFSWDRAAQQQYLDIEVRRGRLLEDALVEQWDRRFLKAGEVLDAFITSRESMVPSVLLIDEIDKLGADSEAALLQILGRGYANIPMLRPEPRVGFFDMSEGERRLAYPIVILTANNDSISEPLRSRCRYCYMEPASMQEMVSILRARRPDADLRLLYQVSKLVNGFMGLPMKDKPALREFLELFETFIESGEVNISLDMIAMNLDCVAKNQKDLRIAEDAVDLLYRNYVMADDALIFEQIRGSETAKRRLVNV